MGIADSSITGSSLSSNCGEYMYEGVGEIDADAVEIELGVELTLALAVGVVLALPLALGVTDGATADTHTSGHILVRHSVLHLKVHFRTREQGIRM